MAKPTDITIENMKSMVIGSCLWSSDSTFQNSCIFDVSLLNSNGRLDYNIQSNTSANSQFGLYSSSTANTENTAFSLAIGASAKASFSVVDAKLAAGFAYDEAKSNSLAEGGTRLSWIYKLEGGYIEIVCSHGKDFDNFASFLAGEPLSDEQLKRHYQFDADTMTFTVSDGNLPDANNPFALIQLISHLEERFSDAAKEADDVSKRASQIKLMVSLKSSIQALIKVFYERYGNGFVSKVHLGAYAIGGGRLNYENSSGNSQNQTAASLSLSVSAFKFGAGVSSKASYAYAHGYKTAMKNINVSAMAIPAKTVDTNALVKSITDMLQNEKQLDAPRVVDFKAATFSIPTDPEFKKKEKAKKEKDKLTPPDSCFNSYDDWKKYKADVEEDSDVNTALASAQQDTEDYGIAALFDEGSEEELNLVKTGHVQEPFEQPLRYSQSIADLRVDDRVVVGFERTPYNAVLPQLRPNLTIPETHVTPNSLPNISKLSVVHLTLSKLSLYLAFLDNFTVSNLKNTEIAAQFDNFYQSFFTEVYALIAKHLKNGRDISTKEAADFMDAQIGTKSPTSSVLFHMLKKSEHAYHYVKYLLEPHVQRIWAQAPGGYLNITYVKTSKGKFSYALPKYLWNDGSVQCNSDTAICTPVLWHDAGVNPMSLMTQQDSPAVHTPLYPVFVYQQRKQPKLYFLQLIRNMQSVLTAQNALFSGPADYLSVSFTKQMTITPKEIVASGSADFEPINQAKQYAFDLTKDGFSLAPKHHSWDFGLNFSFSDGDAHNQQKYADNTPVLVLTNFSQSTITNGFGYGRQFHDVRPGLTKRSHVNGDTKLELSAGPALILKPIKSGSYNSTGLDSHVFSMFSDFGIEQLAHSASLKDAFDLSLI